MQPKASLALALLVALAACTGCASHRAYVCKNDQFGGKWSGRLQIEGEPCGGCDGCESGLWKDYTFSKRLRSALGCGSGCGEMYWGEWHYDPPQACEPCDNWGNYVPGGHGNCCRPRFKDRFMNGLLGHRFCDDCHGPCKGHHEPVDGEVIEIIEPEVDSET